VRYLPLLTLAVAFCTALVGAQPPPPPASDQILSRTESAVRLALSAPPRLRDVALIDASLVANRLTLNFSRGLLSLTPGSLAFEETVTELYRAAADVLRPDFASFEIFTTIEGVALTQFFPELDRPAAPPTARQLAPLAPITPRPAGALTGRRIALSPGHGYYLNGANYVLQRSYFSGIVEDFVNHDFITLLHNLLVADGADVRPTRNLDRTAGVGETGFPRWQEAARYHVKALGADPSIWNEAGFTHLEQDIRCRPRYANSVGAELLVSIHNNGGGGTGTETLYDTNNGFGPESKRLADILHAKVITAIRRDYNPTWADRRVQGFNGSYGENRLATRPAVLIEIAFMDRPTPDNAALRDERFKLLVATAIRDGIREFLDGPTPEIPSTLVATAETGAIALAWRDHSTTEAGFLIERKTDSASTWTALASVVPNTTAYRDTTANDALTYVYRLSAFNAGGNNAGYTNEATARTVTAPVTLILASSTPSATPTLDWNQTAEFALAVTDPTGRPVIGTSLLVRDSLRNTSETLIPLTADATGRHTYRTTVPAGQADGVYSIRFQVAKLGTTASAVLTRDILVAHRPPVALGAPTISAQPLAQSVTAGTGATFAVQTSVPGSADTFPAYQWHFNGSPLIGATLATLTLPTTTASQAGAYSVAVTTPAGSVTSLAAPLTVTPSAWLSNVSLRTTLASTQNVIVGFVVGGNGGTKELLVRAAGPALAAFGLTTAMADPRIELYRDATKLTENNDWPTPLAGTFAALGAFPFPAASRDAALQQALVGAHTVQVAGTAGGVVLVEGYDAGAGSSARLINLSARNRVGTGNDILIAGFYVAGTGTQRVLIRAVGPTLGALGVSSVLADPQLEVTDATVGTRLATNDNWEPSLAPVFAQVGAFALPAGSRDSAAVVTLAAGRSYTVQVSGVANAVGEALVEVYEVP
jgi:N-acetylmuramoyl-L-alanine amidase